jgi:hypothetical protein
MAEGKRQTSIADAWTKKQDQELYNISPDLFIGMEFLLMLRDQKASG